METSDYTGSCSTILGFAIRGLSDLIGMIRSELFYAYCYSLLALVFILVRVGFWNSVLVFDRLGKLCYILSSYYRVSMVSFDWYTVVALLNPVLLLN